jgi:hypothetical protein
MASSGIRRCTETGMPILAVKINPAGRKNIFSARIVVLMKAFETPYSLYLLRGISPYLYQIHNSWCDLRGRYTLIEKAVLIASLISEARWQVQLTIKRTIKRTALMLLAFYSMNLQVVMVCVSLISQYS